MLRNKQAWVAELEEAVFPGSRHAAFPQSGEWGSRKTHGYDTAGPGLQQVSMAVTESLSHRSSQHTDADTSANTAARRLAPAWSQMLFCPSLLPAPHFLWSWRLINSSLMSREHVCRGFNYSRKLAQLVFNVE